ncbi:hypothetical protein HDV00_011341, partial [Rhizophlyctis rosea]
MASHHTPLDLVPEAPDEPEPIPRALSGLDLNVRSRASSVVERPAASFLAVPGAEPPDGGSRRASVSVLEGGRGATPGDGGDSSFLNIPGSGEGRRASVSGGMGRRLSHGGGTPEGGRRMSVADRAGFLTVPGAEQVPSTPPTSTNLKKQSSLMRQKSVVSGGGGGLMDITPDIGGLQFRKGESHDAGGELVSSGLAPIGTSEIWHKEAMAGGGTMHSRRPSLQPPAEHISPVSSSPQSPRSSVRETRESDATLSAANLLALPPEPTTRSRHTTAVAVGNDGMPIRGEDGEIGLAAGSDPTPAFPPPQGVRHTAPALKAVQAAHINLTHHPRRVKPKMEEVERTPDPFTYNPYAFTWPDAWEVRRWRKRLGRKEGDEWTWMAERWRKDVE